MASRRNIDWVTATCEGGPLDGKTVYAANEVGCRIFFSIPSDRGARLIYELIERGTPTSTARARHVPDGVA